MNSLAFAIRAAYVPLDPRHPAKRLSAMIRGADMRALVTHRRCVEMLLNQGRPVLDLDAEENTTTRQWRSERGFSGIPSDLAYVLYTSGSTGKPKGVAVEHRSVMNYVASLSERLSLPAETAFGWVQPLTADSSITTLFGALLTGGCIHVIPRERVVDPDYLTDYGREHQIDVLKIAPTHLAALLQASTDPAAILPRHCLILGGEPLPWSLVERIRKLSPNVRLFNHYGPTETTVGVTMFPVDLEHPSRRGRMVPIGRPLHNVKTYVLDDSMQVCPLGVPGELWLGGACLARGYVNQEETTTSRFVTNPFATEPGERIYRSGDLVVLHPDGNLAFLARTDNQVKIRGFRVEPGEAQSVLLTLPDVYDAAVVPRRGPEGDTRLVAYVVPQGECALNTDELRDVLTRHLPSPVIPSGFVVVNALPRTAHGKLDVGALPDPEEMFFASETGIILPVGELEMRLAAIWETLLSRRQIGRHDNFFDLGGHSLLAVRVINQIENLIEVRLSVAQFFENPTIGALASLIRPRCHTEEKPYVLHVQTEGKRRPFFCMADVEYMFALAKALGPEQPFYGMRIPGLGQEEIPLDTIEAMASYCVRAIERTDPKGPYLVGGHCFGGIVAFEVAQQLTRKGKAVDLLVMLDPDSLTERRRRKLVRFWMYRLWYDIKHRRVMEAIRNRLGALTSILASLWKHSQYQKLKRYNDARWRAREQYGLSSYSGRILFVSSNERVAPPSAYKESIHQTNPWLNAARGDVRELTIEATHTGIFQEPGLRRLVEELRSEFGASEPTQGAE